MGITMALKKCKECGEQVSSDAKSCPNCGKPAPKKTSGCAWIALVVIGIITVGFCQTTTNSYDKYKGRSEAAKAVVVKPRTQPQWTTHSSTDKMTGKVSYYANSPSVTSNPLMDFPYADTSAWLGIGCSSDSEWAYFGFSSSPNLNNTDTQDGYNTFRTRVRWDDDLETLRFSQKWGAKFIHFTDATESIAKLAKSNSARLELDWHGSGKTYFDFPLNGSSNAISGIRKSCGLAN